ncbi:hypothetical protein A2U01_0055399, partial [Trifolium medium]|nr:hypothetical protein [Trifolium medium]
TNVQIADILTEGCQVQGAKEHVRNCTSREIELKGNVEKQFNSSYLSLLQRL